MEWRKLKNLIILILLVVNGFLLVLVGARRQESVRYERSALDRTVQVLQKSGIQVDLAAALPADGLAPISVERDLAREEALARALLGGEVRGDNRGGGLYLYQGALGQVSIRAGGELSAEFTADPQWQTDRPEHHAAAVLKRLEVEAELLDASDRNGDTVVRFRQSWNGAAVFSCEVELTYRGGRLAALSGALLTGPGEAAESGPTLTLPTALMRFSEEIAATGDVCTNLRSMEPGYRGTAQSLSGGVRLVPVWLATTDTAAYYLDCAAGSLTRLAE